uniref:Protein phosphatase 1 regulatory subunit 15A/B C-terminal domain-containing protein n=1 Tax=Amphilophus citrinellus TaxID=61819 RepID=A0A3Q0RLN1_AMPCI
MKTSFVNEESDFLSQLDDVQLGPPHLSYLQCEHDGAAGLQDPRGAGSLPWLSTDSLREIGLQSGTEVDLSLCQQTQFGYFSSVRTVLGHVLLSSQEVRAAGGQSWSPSTSRTWWGSFWGGKESSQRGQLSDVPWVEEGVLAGRLCPQQTPRRKLGENAGPADHKGHLPNNGGLHTVQNAEEATSDRRLSIGDQLSCSGATAAGEASPVTPEQDNGYSSLEEEHLSTLTSPREELPLQEAETSECVEMEGDTSEEEEEAVLESSSDDDDDDDDGFDSEGSSELSDDTDEDDGDNSDSEADSEAERLWSSLCQNEDPYNPQNFTARLHNIPASTSPSSPHSTPSSSPPSGSDSWDDSASASEVDEESLRLWDSFSSSPDPFNPLNFQLARDRCRFLRRCQEVEQSIAYCLQPQHRRRVYERLAVL